MSITDLLERIERSRIPTSAPLYTKEQRILARLRQGLLRRHWVAVSGVIEQVEPGYPGSMLQGVQWLYTIRDDLGVAYIVAELHVTESGPSAIAPPLVSLSTFLEVPNVEPFPAAMQKRMMFIVNVAVGLCLLIGAQTWSHPGLIRDIGLVGVIASVAIPFGFIWRQLYRYKKALILDRWRVEVEKAKTKRR